MPYPTSASPMGLPGMMIRDPRQMQAGLFGQQRSPFATALPATPNWMRFNDITGPMMQNQMHQNPLYQQLGMNPQGMNPQQMTTMQAGLMPPQARGRKPQGAGMTMGTNVASLLNRLAFSARGQR